MGNFLFPQKGGEALFKEATFFSALFFGGTSNCGRPSFFTKVVGHKKFFYPPPVFKPGRAFSLGAPKQLESFLFPIKREIYEGTCGKDKHFSAGGGFKTGPPPKGCGYQPLFCRRRDLLTLSVRGHFFRTTPPPLCGTKRGGGKILSL